MPVTCRNSVVAIALVLFALEADANEPSGSVANVPTPMSAGRPTASSAGTTGATKPNERLREGTKLVDVIGTFQSAGGDSLAFSRDGGKESFRVLENQWLQRVGQVLENNPAGRQWIVSGVITEYRSANYLLLTKAVMPLQDVEGAARPKTE